MKALNPNTPNKEVSWIQQVREGRSESQLKILEHIYLSLLMYNPGEMTEAGHFRDSLSSLYFKKLKTM